MRSGSLFVSAGGEASFVTRSGWQQHRRQQPRAAQELNRWGCGKGTSCLARVNGRTPRWASFACGRGSGSVARSACTGSNQGTVGLLRDASTNMAARASLLGTQLAATGSCATRRTFPRKERKGGSSAKCKRCRSRRMGGPTWSCCPWRRASSTPCGVRQCRKMRTRRASCALRCSSLALAKRRKARLRPNSSPVRVPPTAQQQRMTTTMATTTTTTTTLRWHAKNAKAAVYSSRSSRRQRRRGVRASARGLRLWCPRACNVICLPSASA
mmetsp:Transcript_43228/g.85265  ORF Transcript_43228/g.85265 Transcript_43228/m.85265 type:complete len:270 (-) Transcript_43228:1234-2043(-)